MKNSYKFCKNRTLQDNEGPTIKVRTMLDNAELYTSWNDEANLNDKK